MIGEVQFAVEDVYAVDPQGHLICRLEGAIIDCHGIISGGRVDAPYNKSLW